MDLFEDNVDLVKKIASKMNYGYASLDDITQAGLMGLFYATKNYDSSLNVKFNTYATYYIIGEIKKELRNNNLIKLSKELFRVIKYINQEPNESIEETSIKLNTAKENVILAYSYKTKVISLDKDLTENDDKSLSGLDIVVVDNSDARKKNIIDAVEDLNNQEKEIIKLRYFNNYTQSEVAEILKKNQSKVSRLEKSAIKSLRKIIIV